MKKLLVKLSQYYLTRVNRKSTKYEYRNSKQIQNNNDQMSKARKIPLFFDIRIPNLFSATKNTNIKAGTTNMSCQPPSFSPMHSGNGCG